MDKEAHKDCEHCKYWTGEAGDKAGKCTNKGSEHWGDSMFNDETCSDWVEME